MHRILWHVTCTILVASVAGSCWTPRKMRTISGFDQIGASSALIASQEGWPHKRFATLAEAYQYTLDRFGGSLGNIRLALDVGPKTAEEAESLRALINEATAGEREQAWWIYDDKNSRRYLTTIHIVGFIDEKLVLSAHPGGNGLDLKIFLNHSK
jgi:hypothetical protein